MAKETVSDVQPDTTKVAQTVDPPTIEQLANSPSWGIGGRYVINPATGERESAAQEE